MTLDGIDYEAFNTSGGVGTLGETLAGRVRNLNYKTIRYPGHCEIMKHLIRDLRLDEADARRDLRLRPPPHVAGRRPHLRQRDGEERVASPGRRPSLRKVRSRVQGGTHWSAIQITTASAICAVLDLVAEGKLPQRGFLRQEDVALATSSPTASAAITRDRAPFTFRWLGSRARRVH